MVSMVLNEKAGKVGSIFCVKIVRQIQRSVRRREGCLYQCREKKAKKGQVQKINSCDGVRRTIELSSIF